MSKRTIITLALSVVFVLSVVTVYAAIGGVWSIQTGNSIWVEGYATGVGGGGKNTDVSVTLKVEATFEGFCTTKGGNAAPGQNPVEATISKTVSGLTPDKTGKVVVEKSDLQVNSLWTEVFPDYDEEDLWMLVGCPNSNWTVDNNIYREKWDSALIEVFVKRDGQIFKYGEFGPYDGEDFPGELGCWFFPSPTSEGCTVD